MPPKGAAEKKPAAKAPLAAKAPAADKKDTSAGKKTAATGDKKKRTKTRKETYSSYIYKGMVSPLHSHIAIAVHFSYRVKRATRVYPFWKPNNIRALSYIHFIC
jgi:hypothetical protein